MEEKNSEIKYVIMLSLPTTQTLKYWVWDALLLAPCLITIKVASSYRYDLLSRPTVLPWNDLYFEDSVSATHAVAERGVSVGNIARLREGDRAVCVAPSLPISQEASRSSVPRRAGLWAASMQHLATLTVFSGSKYTIYSASLVSPRS